MPHQGGPLTFLLPRPEQVQASLGPPGHFMGELKDTEPPTSPSRLPLASSSEHQDESKPCEHSDSGLEVLEAEQDSLHLCLLRLNFRLQDLEQGLGSWTLAHNRIVQLQVGSRRPEYGGVDRVLGMGVSFLG